MGLTSTLGPQWKAVLNSELTAAAPGAALPTGDGGTRARPVEGPVVGRGVVEDGVEHRTDIRRRHTSSASRKGVREAVPKWGNFHVDVAAGSGWRRRFSRVFL